MVPKYQDNWTDCERIIWTTWEAQFLSIINITRQFIFLDLMPSERLWKLNMMRTNCQAQPGNIVLSIINIPRDTLWFWTWCHPKDWENWKECEQIIGLARKAQFLSITNTPRDTLCFWTLFRPKDQENWTECERIVWPARKAEFFSTISIPRQCMFLDLMSSKRLWKLKSYERIVGVTRKT